MAFYTEEQRNLQDRYEARRRCRWGDRCRVERHHSGFISTRDFFCLSTVTAAGEPTVSYKGGGTVKVIDETTRGSCGRGRC